MKQMKKFILLFSLGSHRFLPIEKISRLINFPLMRKVPCQPIHRRHPARFRLRDRKKMCPILLFTSISHKINPIRLPSSAPAPLQKKVCTALFICIDFF